MGWFDRQTSVVRGIIYGALVSAMMWVGIIALGLALWGQFAD